MFPVRSWAASLPSPGAAEAGVEAVEKHPLQYVFDKWMQKHFPNTSWCRYADDGLLHCYNEAQAEHILKMLKNRFLKCGLELHPQKTKIVYCKDGQRKGPSRAPGACWDFPHPWGASMRTHPLTFWCTPLDEGFAREVA